MTSDDTPDVIKGEDMNNLKEIIRRSKYRTQERFAEATGINESIVSKYCRGLRKVSKRHQEIIKKTLIKKGTAIGDDEFNSQT